MIGLKNKKNKKPTESYILRAKKGLLKNQQVKTKIIARKSFNFPHIESEKKIQLSHFTKPILYINGLFIIILIGSFFYFSHQPAEIRIISNDSNYDITNIISILNLKANSFAEVETANLTFTLNKQPPVKMGKVKKFPPQTLGILIQGRQPYVVFNLSGKKYLLDDQLIAYAEFKDEILNLPQLIMDKRYLPNFKLGLPINSMNVKAGLDWIASIKNNVHLTAILNLNDVKTITISNPYAFVIKTTNRNYIVLYNEIERQMQQLKYADAYIKQEDIKNKIIDLRIENRIILQ